MNLSLLHVTISILASTLTPDQPVKVDVTVRNTANHPVTILSWDSPLDPKAGILGGLEMENIATGEPVPLVMARFARQLPPSLDDFIEIKSHHEATSSTTIPTLGLNLPLDTTFEVHARGTWRAVWDGAKADISRATLEAMTGGSTGEFKSNKAKVKTDTTGGGDQGVLMEE